MRQLRLGSYSIEATVAGTPSLLRRKSIDPVAALVTAAAVAGGLATVVVATAGRVLGGQQRLLGPVVVTGRRSPSWSGTGDRGWSACACGWP